MTLPVNPNRVAYSGNGTLTAFAFPYRFFDEEDLKVIVRDGDGDNSTQSLNTDFSVTGADDENGGTVTFINAPDASSTVFIYRDPALNQELDLQDKAAFAAENVEREFDRQVAMLQRMDERLDRVFQLSDTDTTGVELVLPDASDRANTFLAFDQSGRVIPSSGTAGVSVPVSTFMETVLDDTNGVSALTTLGLSTLARNLSDDTDASQHLGTLGFSTLAKNLCDDTDASQFLTTVLMTISDVTAIRALFRAISQTHSVISTGTSGHGSASNKVRRFTTNTVVGTAISVSSDSTLGTVYTINETGLYAMKYQDAGSGGIENIAITLDATGADLTANVGTSGANRLAFGHCNTASVANIFALAHLTASQIIRAQDAGGCDSTFTQFRIHRLGF